MKFIARHGSEEIPVEVERHGNAYRVRLGDRWLRAGIKVSKIVGDYTDAWRELCARTQEIRGAWPQSNVPELPLLDPKGGLFAAVQLEIYRQSAVLNDLAFAEPTGAARAPGGKSGLEFNPERIKPLVDEMDGVRAWLASVLEERVDGRTGQPIPSTTEPAAATPAA